MPRLLYAFLGALLPLLGFAAQPRIVFLTVGGEADPTAEIRLAAQPWADRLSVDVLPNGSGFTAERPADLVVVDAKADFPAAVTNALAASSARLLVLRPEGNATLRDTVGFVDTPTLSEAWANASVANYRRVLTLLATRVLGLGAPPGVAVNASALTPIVYPKQAIYHPDAPAPGFFPDYERYLAWQQTRAQDPGSAAPVVGISFHRSFFLRENVATIDALIRAGERRGARVVALMSHGAPDYQTAWVRDGRAVVDVLLFLGERLSIADKDAGLAQVRALGVPVLSTFQHFRVTPADYRASPGGMAPELTSVIVDHERDALFEPLLVSAKGPGARVGPDAAAVLSEQIDWRMERALAWARLRRTANPDKRLVFTYWSEGAGKANVGGDPDDFLDVPGSLARLLPALRERGYDVGPDPLPSRDQLSDRMARDASNVGTWAPGELAERVARGAFALLPVETYQTWWDALPASRREEIEAMWGPPPGKVMVHTDAQGRRFFVIPRLQFGHVLIAAHPDWGYLQDDKALVSKGALPPHHQYLAFFLWLQREWRADAWVSLFSNIVLQPGKSEGPLADDHIGLLLGALPHIHPEKLGGNGGISNKRKGLALTPGWANQVVPSDALARLAELSARLQRYEGITDPAQRANAEQAVREEATRLALARELDLDPASAPFPALRDALIAHRARLERAHMPNGSHVLGEPPTGRTLTDMVALMAEPDLRPRLPAALDGAAYRALVARAIEDPAPPTDLAAPQVALVRDYAERLRAAPREVTALFEALEGRWLEPGPFDEPLRNPDALPAGRVLYGFDQRQIPTPEAEIGGRAQADALIAAHRQKNADAYPQKLAFVLWSSAIAKTGGVNEAAMLHLLGTRVTRDARGVVTGVELIPRAELGRPRIDVLATTSGTYRDHYQDKVDLLAQAVRLAATSPEEDNPVAAAVRARTTELRAGGQVDAARAAQLASARVFSPAPNAYSPSIQFLAKAGDARGDETAMANLYLNRLSHAYGGGLYGDSQRPLFEKAIANIDAATLARPGVVNSGVLDNPMPAGFLGGLNLAVKQVAGRDITLYTSDVSTTSRPQVETVQATIARELQTRYFNPKFITAMMARGYDGARYPMFLAEHFDLWDSTAPDTVTTENWSELKAVYVDDKHGLGLREFFQKHNPFAKQMIMANLLQASERGHWQATAAELTDLARQLAQSAKENGFVCEANVCRNAALTALVEKSLAGAPDAAQLVADYRAAMDKIVGAAPAATAPTTPSTPANAAPAPVGAPAAAQSAPPASAELPQVTGKALETVSRSAPADAVHAETTWLWPLLAAAAALLFGFGWFRSARP